MSRADVCLTLVVAQELEEMLIDLLLEREDIVRRFGSYPIDAHGARIGYANLAEQVRGRSRRVEFQLLMMRDNIDSIVSALRERLPRAEITYWALPLLTYGRIN
jgi:hypothetical protein